MEMVDDCEESSTRLVVRLPIVESHHSPYQCSSKLLYINLATTCCLND